MKRAGVFSLILATLALTGPGLAQKESPPPGEAPKGYSLPATETLSLDNGMGIVLVPYGEIPKVTLRMVIRSGNVNEKADEVWLADLVGNYLKEGTESTSAEVLAQRAASMGGTLSVGVGADQTTVGIEVLSEFAPEAAELLADVIQHPMFPDSELERLQTDLLRQLSMQKTQPESLALEKFRKILYRDHPYGQVFPSEEMIRGYTVERVRQFYASNFGAARSDLYVAGKFDASAAKTTIEQAFGGWASGPQSESTLPKPTSERRTYLVNRPGASQSNLLIGLPVVDPSNPDYVPLLVMDSLLGGSFASRITTNIREDKGYTYSPYSSISVRYRDAYWVESASVGTAVTGPAIKEILYEIDRLRKEPPSVEELEGIKNYLAGIFVLRNSSRSGIISQLAFVRLHGLDASYLTDHVKRILAVTPDQVQQLAGRYLADDQFTIVVVGDRDKVLSQLKPFGPMQD
jgi:predicted Zn-dependent peptidase